MTKSRMAAGAGLAGVGLWAWGRRGSVWRFFQRRRRYARGQVEGLQYRLAGRRPAPNVADDVLADRVRSALGPVARQLDIPHVHVMVEDHVALLHGDVGSERDASEIEEKVLATSGVSGVRSHLRVGLVTGDTRPSQGSQGPSEQRAALVSASRQAGAGSHAEDATAAVVTTLARRLPAEERHHLFSHLPADVRVMAEQVRGGPDKSVKSPTDFNDAVAAASGITTTEAEVVTQAVLAALRRIVPEEVGHVADVLPARLQALWQGEDRRSA